MTRTPHRLGGSRAGTLVAVLLALACIGVVVYYVARPQHAGGATDARTPADEPIPVVNVGEQPIGEGLATGIQVMDRGDPTRLAAVINYQRLEPERGRRFLVEQPVILVYLDTGRTIRIRAASARWYRPDDANPPESGQLEGGVRVELFEARADGSRVDPEADEPVVTLETPAIQFDTLLAQVSTHEPFVAAGRAFTLSGTGLSATFNEVRERLEYLRIREGGRLVLLPGIGRGPLAEPPPPQQAPARAQAGGTRTPQDQPAANPQRPPAPVDAFYRLTLGGDVRLVGTTRTMHADTLIAWAMLRDGSLPEGAILALASDEPANSAQPRQQPPAASPARSAPDAPTSVQPVEPAPQSEEWVLTWTGPCEVVPLDGMPADFADQQVAARLTAENTGLVRMADASLGATGQCASMDYGATTGRLVLRGPGPASVLLTLDPDAADERPDAAEFQQRVQLLASKIVAELSTGVVNIPGPGVATSADGSEASWTRQADFDLLRREGRLVGLRRAVLAGTARVVRGDDLLVGDRLVATFDENASTRPTLSRLLLAGSAALSNRARNQGLTGNLIDIALIPDRRAGAPAGRAVPSVVTATGDVVGNDKGTTLHAAFVEAQLEQDEKGGTRVASAVARGDVRYADPQGYTASADEAHATPADGVTELLGKVVRVAHRGVSGIQGGHVRLDSRQRRIAVLGPGSFDHRQPDQASRGTLLVDATWTRTMTFSDLDGHLTCDGEAVVTATIEGLARDRADAGRIELWFTPADREAAADPAVLANLGIGDRRVVRAEAHAESGGVARLESTRFATVEGRSRPVRVLYLEGALILADDERGVVEVPGAGRGFVLDEPVIATGEPVAAPGARPAPGLDAHGRTLIDWAGSMNVDRAASTMILRDSARLTHRAAADATLTDLVCEDLTISFRPRAGAEGGREAYEITKALATGAVYVASGPGGAAPAQELVADAVEYDLIRGVVTAHATEGNRVVVFDAARAAPLSAARLLWTLGTNRFEILEPAPVTAPKPE